MFDSDMRDINVPSVHGITDDQPEQIFFEYLSKSYKVFLTGNDDFDSMVQDLANNFDQKNSIISADLNRISVSLSALEKEYQSFVSDESPLNKAEREKNIYANDIEKFKKFMSHLAVKKQKLLESVDRSVIELQELEKELVDVELQRTSLQGHVDAQDIRPEDIDKMNAEKEMLCKTIETLNQAKEETSKIFWDREVQVQKRMDSVEKLIQEYNFGCEKSGLVPIEAHNSQGLRFELSFNQHALRYDQMLDLDIKEHIQANLLHLRDGYNKIIHETQASILDLQETLDRLTEITNDKVDDLKGLEEKIRKINQQYAEDKEVTCLYRISWFIIFRILSPRIKNQMNRLIFLIRIFKECGLICHQAIFNLNKIFSTLRFNTTKLLGKLQKRRKERVKRFFEFSKN